MAKLNDEGMFCFDAEHGLWSISAYTEVAEQAEGVVFEQDDDLGKWVMAGAEAVLDFELK